MSGSSPTDTNLTVTALTVSLCALILTLGQLLGQYFATADGYRRCQPSVMGLWAKRTRLRWRWSQFRFETLFTTPEISLTPFYIDQDRQKSAVNVTDEKAECISGTPVSRINTMAVSSVITDNSDELACWVPFLESLHKNEQELQEYGCYNYQMSGEQQELVGPVVRFRERSWDFVPPDILRPLAISTVSHIAVMARRLGMSWAAFRPEDGVMRAEGNGQIISSTFMRSHGIILHYKFLGRANPSSRSSFSSTKRGTKSEMHIPRREADMMGFGILPGYDRLGIPTCRIGSIDEVLATMDVLDPTRKASGKLRDIRRLLVGKWDADCTYGFSDLIALAAPMLRLKNSTIIRLPIPTPHHSSITSSREGFVVFYNRLQEYVAERGKTAVVKHVGSPGEKIVAIPEQIGWIMQQYESLKTKYAEWEDEVRANDQANNRDQAFLEEAHTSWDMTTNYFLHLQNRLSYYDLMASHISHAVNYWGEAWEHIRSNKTRNHYGLRALEAEGMHLYFDYLPSIIASLRLKGFNGADELVHEAWFTLMFRAFCWWRCHYFCPGQDQMYGASILPSQYWDSNLPVYIG